MQSEAIEIAVNFQFTCKVGSRSSVFNKNR